MWRHITLTLTPPVTNCHTLLDPLPPRAWHHICTAPNSALIIFKNKSVGMLMIMMIDFVYNRNVGVAFWMLSHPQLGLRCWRAFSLYANVPDFVDSLVVSCGYQTIHVLPVLGRSLDVQHCRRLNYGGAQVDSFMHRILQLKYPGHFSALTLTRAEVCLTFLFIQWIFISLLFINLWIFINLLLFIRL